MSYSRTRIRLHMGCGETLSGRLIAVTEYRHSGKLEKHNRHAGNGKHKSRQVTTK